MDRFRVIQGAEQYWAGREAPALLARVSFQAGDMFESVPVATSNKDIYLLSAVLHGFDDESCAKVLRNLASASGATGARIVLMELVMAEARGDFATAAVDMQMFMGTRGRERTLNDWRRLVDECGLMLEEEINLRSFAKMLVLLPREATHL